VHYWLKGKGKWDGQFYSEEEAVEAVVAWQRAQDQERELRNRTKDKDPAGSKI